MKTKAPFDRRQFAPGGDDSPLDENQLVPDENYLVPDENYLALIEN